MGAGVILDRWLGVDKRSLSRTAVYILSPCLVFSLVAQSTIDLPTFGQMMLYALVVTLAMTVIALAVGRLLGWSSRKTDGLVLATAFVNSGNLGLSVILFSYGEPGLALASVFFVVTNLATHTLAAFFAGRGQQGSALEAIRAVLKLPAIYAFALALALRLLGLSAPPPLLNAVDLAGRAAVPLMLMMVGLQLSQTNLGNDSLDVAIGVGLRLLVGPLVAAGLASVFGLQGLARNVGIVEASMPTAVTSSLMAIEFGADPEYVTSVVFLSTLLSSITLTVLIAAL